MSEFPHNPERTPKTPSQKISDKLSADFGKNAGFDPDEILEQWTETDESFDR